MKKPYNGHESYAAWNVSLWLGNDEGLYRLALAHVRACKNKGVAAKRILIDLPQKTPDGVRYSLHTVLLAIRGLE